MVGEAPDDWDRWSPLPGFTVQPRHSHPRLCDVSLLPCTAHLAPYKDHGLAVHLSYS